MHQVVQGDNADTVTAREGMAAGYYCEKLCQCIPGWRGSAQDSVRILASRV